MKNKKVKKQETKRTLIQLIATALSNGYIIGFFNHTIFTGKSKMLCVPGLNCYSCPGATGACPIGAMQAVLGGKKHSFTYYVTGTIMLFGVLFGRLICGFLCPFGLFQDLLYKIPVPKLHIPKKIDKPLRFLKYILAVIFVVFLPLFITNAFGMGDPFFCKYICPVGTLEGGIPLVSTTASLRAQLGFLFNWKMGILVFVVLSSIFVYRPFCKFLCPLGAFYSLFNKLSFYQMHVDMDKCIQ
ncbi:MAG TPA: 4Fe-4S binding protein, partial [Treponemataceae bacterium]|nr:4Fe-4S binding protein [Treponemataceae bacterium]